MKQSPIPIIILCALVAVCSVAYIYNRLVLDAERRSSPLRTTITVYNPTDVSVVNSVGPDTIWVSWRNVGSSHFEGDYAVQPGGDFSLIGKRSAVVISWPRQYRTRINP